MEENKRKLKEKIEILHTTIQTKEREIENIREELQSTYNKELKNKEEITDKTI